MLKIGPYIIDSQVLLAPMAGVTDLPFRKLCRHYGAGLTTSEMLSSDTALWHTEKSRHRMTFELDSAPMSLQIAGSEPKMMANAAKACVDQGAQIIDINMGCPAKKVCKKLAGSALMQNETLVADILAAVVSAVKVPVTLKIRTGWNIRSKNGLTIAKIAESEGIQALTVHGRTRECRFMGHAEYDTIAEIVAGTSIPVIANGDIDSAEKAESVLKCTGAQAVMVGRAAFGKPWIFSEINAHLKRWPHPKRISRVEIKSVIVSHFNQLYEFYGNFKGLRIARKHFAWYCQNAIGELSTKAVVKQFNQLEISQSQLDIVQQLFEQSDHYEEYTA
ncbi:MAG: tRNA-dihydrouridine synthase B [Lentisphaeria bacterium]